MKFTELQYIFESKTTEADKLTLKEGIALAKELLKKMGIRVVDTVGPSDLYKPNKAYLVGSIRRQKTHIGDVDILITKKITQQDVLKVEGVDDLTSRGDKQIFFDYTADNGKTFPINIWMLPKEQSESFGAFMMHTTGSHKNNMLLRMIAKRNGNKLNQYGLFNKANEQIAGDTEESVYSNLYTKKWPAGKDWVKPADRNK
jgi:DNA polymerase (family 10)